nr:class I SAM-dependent methyltransferase [uncultured bacterium]
MSEALFSGARMLDIGCGPRGSLEWATQARERVGLDPLAGEYQKLHERTHAMRYVTGNVERIPFDDGHFDVVSTINSLDHVDDVQVAVGEITRVTREGGMLLLFCDVGHEPTPTEPQAFGWEILDRFADGWTVVDRRDFERPSDNMTDNLTHGEPFDHGDSRPRPGIVTARLQRTASRGPAAQ